MTKRLILTSVICLFTMLQMTSAQYQLENAGFEEWENGSTSKPETGIRLKTARARFEKIKNKERVLTGHREKTANEAAPLKAAPAALTIICTR